MVQQTVIELRDVNKIYRMGEVEVPALKNVSLKIKQKEFVGVQGPSGSGKSTLMNMIGCLDKPTHGHLFLDGKDTREMTESDLAQVRGKKIGFVFQKFNLIPTLTAEENVALPMVFQGMHKIERLRKARELLTMVELNHRMGHKPSEMSGGEQQRVAIARSLANDPEVVLADEPTGNLDSKTGEAVMALLKKLHDEQGKTIVLVTHDPEDIKYAKRTIYIKDGETK